MWTECLFGGQETPPCVLVGSPRRREVKNRTGGQVRAEQDGGRGEAEVPRRRRDNLFVSVSSTLYTIYMLLYAEFLSTHKLDHFLEG